MVSKPMSAAMLTGGRRLADPQLAPDGRSVSLLTRAGARTELTLIDLSNGVEWQLPLEPGVAGSRGGSHRWLPDGNRIVYIGADARIHVFDLRELSTRSITDELDSPCALAVSNNAELAAFVANDLHDVFVVATDGSSLPVRLSTDADFVVDPVFSVYSDRLAWVEWDVPNMAWDESRLVVRDVQASEPVRVAYAKPNVSVQQPRWSPDGQRLSFLCDETGWTNLWSMDARELTNAAPVFEEEFDSGDLTWGPGQSTYAWSRSADTVQLNRNDEGFGLLLHRHVSDGELIKQHSGTVSNVHAIDGKVVALVSDYARATEAVVFEDGDQRVIARSSYFGVEAKARVPEVVAWKSVDGTYIPGRLYRASADDGVPPLMVWVHGGPHGQSPATFYPRWTYFIERGWSILVTDQRGTNGWGRKHLDGLRGGYGDVDVDDVVSGIHAAIENGWCDPQRIVLIGGSSAGLTLLMALAQNPSLCAAGVAIFPVTDLEATASDTHRFEKHYFDSLVGPLPDKRGLYSARSPITHAAAIKTPVLLLHGTNDESVPCGQTIEMAKAIERTGGTVEVHLYEGEGHGWRAPETQIDELERVEAFVCRYVLDVANEERSS